jgi:hypothetical protein
MIGTMRRVVCVAAFVWGAVWGSATGWGCLHELLDARAIQWSTLIVQGKLISISAAKQMAAAATTQPSGWSYEIYTFQVSDVFAGPDVTGQVRVIRFLGPDATRSDPCGQELSQQSLGNAYVLMLRPEADVKWSKSASEADPRDDSVHALKAYVFVHLEASDDLGSNGIADLKREIDETRAADSQFSADQAAAEARTLANAADDTEADEAEQALENMGYRAEGAVEEVMRNVGETGKERLERVLNAISVPTMVR